MKGTRVYGYLEPRTDPNVARSWEATALPLRIWISKGVVEKAEMFSGLCAAGLSYRGDTMRTLQDRLKVLIVSRYSSRSLNWVIFE